MPRTRPAYPEEFRTRAVDLLRSSGKSQKDVAREFGVSSNALREWAKRSDLDAGRARPRRPGLPRGCSEQALGRRHQSARVVPGLDEVEDRSPRLLAGPERGTVARQRPDAGLVHHSDRGCQYTSFIFGQRCREAGIAPSMGSVGDAYDNAMAEAFFATLECELLDRPMISLASDRSERGRVRWA